MQGDNTLWGETFARNYYPFSYQTYEYPSYFTYPYFWNYSPNNFPQYNYQQNGFSFSPQVNSPIDDKPEEVPFANPQEQVSQSPQEEISHDNELQIENGGLQSQEVKPKKKIQKKNDKWRQKYGRNINSNIFHMAIKKILSKRFSSSIKKIIEVNKMIIKESQFLSKLNEKSRNLQTYISAKALEKILNGSLSGMSQLDCEYKKILRIIMVEYLKNEHIPHIFSSRKIKKQSRELHLAAIRKLIRVLGRY